MEALRAQQAVAAQEAEDARQEALRQVAQLEDEMRQQDIERDATANHPLTVTPVDEGGTGRNKRYRDHSPGQESDGNDDGEYFDDGGRPSDSTDSGPESEEEVAIVPPKQRKKKVKTRRADIDAARVVQPASGTPDPNDISKSKQKPNTPAPAKKQKPSKPALSGLVSDWQGHRSRNVSTTSSVSSGVFGDTGSGVGYGGLVPDNETGDVEWPSTPGLNTGSSKLVTMIKVSASSHHAPTTKKAARGGSHKWTHSHLPHGTVDLFKDSVVRLARIKAGMKEPWSGLTTIQVQEIVDEVFGDGKYQVTDTDVWCGLIAYRLNDWRAMFGQQGIKTVTHLVEDNPEVPNTTAAVADAIREYLWVPDGEQSAAFLWREFNGGKAKKGLLQSHLILRVFAHAHLVLFDDPLDAIHGEHKPVGALLLAMQAVEHALSFWKTGELEEDRTSAGHFSYDNYSDKTMQDKKTKQFQFDDSHWCTLVIAAMEHLEDLAPAKNRASTSSHPNSEIVDADDEILLMSDPVDDDSVMEPYSIIDTINVFVPSIAKGALAFISAILGIIKVKNYRFLEARKVHGSLKKTFANHSDFKELAEQCQMISLVIWNNTHDVPDRQIGASLRRALSDLKSIRNAVEDKAKKTIGSQAFHASVNQETIVKWRSELNRFLALFNIGIAPLNMSSNLELHKLLTLFKEFRATSFWNLQGDIQAPDELPTPPSVLFGRDGLVFDTIKHLLKCRLVALIAEGGMGKSSIARAILNDEAIIANFQTRRFFVRFDDMNPAQMTFGTFIDRMARALGVPTSTNTHDRITKTLSTLQTLIILDNAETALDAASDAGDIANAIDEFGNRPNVAILVTTRTSALPHSLKWVRTKICPLEPIAGYDAFTEVYTRPIEREVVIKLLSDVAFHPLSINLLAHTGVENDWSPEDLVHAWGHQLKRLPLLGGSKPNSLAVTIETSLHTPSITSLGETVSQLLQIIALLPQGMSKRLLTAMSSMAPTIESCAIALCKHSLAYGNGGFITLLAPIRLYILECFRPYLPNNPLLEEVRLYYESHADEAEIVLQEDLNMEHVLAQWAEDPVARSSVLRLITNFSNTLYDFRPRPLTILPAIYKLAPGKSTNPASFMHLIRAFPSSPQRVDALVGKGQCLFCISLLMRFVGETSQADEALIKARDLLLKAGRIGRAELLVTEWRIGMFYLEQDNYIATEGLFRFASKRGSTKFGTSRTGEAFLLKAGLSSVSTFRGRSGGSKHCLKAIPLMEKMGQPDILVVLWRLAGIAELNDGHLDLAQKYFLEAQAVGGAGELESSPIRGTGGTDSYPIHGAGEIESHPRTFLWLAEVADRQGKYADSKALRANSLELIQKNLPNIKNKAYAIGLVSILACYLARDGNIVGAQELIAPAVENAANQLSIYSVIATYLAGCIELIAGNFDLARDYFQQTFDDCVSVSEFSTRARTQRALGELAIIRRDFAAARTHFDATSELCTFMGIPKDGMYRDYGCYRLGDAFNGWNLYQEDLDLSVAWQV
ncbi:hypothetical protein DXG01_010543 [Tephrocybe rancida]|nr:hypothetical protein DXG01_010543 [Tephrocybe rancida]